MGTILVLVQCIVAWGLVWYHFIVVGGKRREYWKLAKQYINEAYELLAIDKKIKQFKDEHPGEEWPFQLHLDFMDKAATVAQLQVDSDKAKKLHADYSHKEGIYMAIAWSIWVACYQLQHYLRV